MTLALGNLRVSWMNFERVWKSSNITSKSIKFRNVRSKIDKVLFVSDKFRNISNEKEWLQWLSMWECVKNMQKN